MPAFQAAWQRCRRLSAAVGVRLGELHGAGGSRTLAEVPESYTQHGGGEGTEA